MFLRKLFVAGLVVAACYVGTAEAQVSRVFVSVNGNDANTCSNVATPCRTIGGGVSQVDAQGEVIVIDSGSFAGGTISKAVKINVAAGAVAFSGLPITVTPGAGNMVVIRGLTLKAVTPGSGNGITLSSGRLSVERSVIDGWNNGIFVDTSAESLWVGDTVLRNNGVPVSAMSGTAHVVIENSRSIDNVYGLEIHGGTASISGTEISGRTTGIYVSNSVVAVNNCRITNKQYGVYVVSGGTARLADNVITKNGTGVTNSGSTVESYGTNQIRGNTTNTSGTITSVGLQ